MSLGATVYMALMAVLALFGLVLASGAQDPGFGLFAYALILFGIVNIFVLIHRATGTPGD